MENQGIASSSLFRGAAAYEPRTPWTPIRALLAGVVIVGASILGAVLVLGIGNVGGTTGGDGPDTWHQDMGADMSAQMGALATLAVWQAIAVVLTLLASALYGGRASDVLALRSPGPYS